VYDGNGTPLEESAVGNHYLWQGRRYSWETGLYYFRARWYDPVTGRWLSKDPIGISGGLNQYVFCGNNPVNFRDPFGLCEDDGPGFWGMFGNALNNTVSAINQSMGQGLYDLSQWQWSQDVYLDIGDLMWSTDTPAAPQATPYIAGSLGVSAAAATTAGVLIGLEAAGVTDVGSRPIGSGPPPDYRHDTPPSKPHYDKNTGQHEPDHWHKRDYDWSPTKKKWFPGKWKYFGPDAP